MMVEYYTAIVPIATLDYEEVSLIIDILKRRYPKPTPMIKDIIEKLEARISDYLEYKKTLSSKLKTLEAKRIDYIEYKKTLSSKEDK